jgi:hypothetical protein
VAQPAREPNPEVLGLDEAGIAGLLGREVDQPQRIAHLPHDQAGQMHALVQLQFGQRAELALPAEVDHVLHPVQLPPGVLPLGVGEQPPFDFCDKQGSKTEQIE